MEIYCHACGAKLEPPPGGSITCRDECPECNTDLHTCVCCRHYDEHAYNNCKEPQAERVVEKRRKNYCDYFEFKQQVAPNGDKDKKEDYLKELDSLFK